MHSLQGKVGDNLLYLMHAIQERKPELFLEGEVCNDCTIVSAMHAALLAVFHYLCWTRSKF
jgi:hypothetical protein